MRVRRFAVLVLVVLHGAVACERPTAVHFTVAPGSTVTNLVFVREPSAERPMIRGVAVRSADGRHPGSTGHALWTMVASGSRELPTRDSLRYAAPWARFAASHASLLTPGEYRLEVQTGGRTTITYFPIASDGHVSS